MFQCMTTNAYLLTYKSDEEYGECVLSAFTIAGADESWGRMYPDTEVVAVSLIGEFVSEEEE
jgi:hypothetical protein